MASRRRVDVHGIHSEFVRDIIGPICGGYTARHLPQHHVDEACKAIGGRRLGAVICHMSAAISWFN